MRKLLRSTPRTLSKLRTTALSKTSHPTACRWKSAQNDKFINEQIVSTYRVRLREFFFFFFFSFSSVRSKTSKKRYNAYITLLFSRVTRRCVRLRVTRESSPRQSVGGKRGKTIVNTVLVSSLSIRLSIRLYIYIQIDNTLQQNAFAPAKFTATRIVHTIECLEARVLIRHLLPLLGP